MQKPLLLLIKDTTREKIENEEILYATVEKHYTKIVLINDRNFIVRTSLRRFEKRLPPNLFIRIHKNYIVCLRHIRYVDTVVTMKNGEPLPISKEFKESFLSNFDII
ncbi:LytR/AlgR family response regulator transcription factor [Chitinophaga pinensis]|uniref:Response regulator receiver protein n=1 Tax=Chitinophaga pinensis (strain ATCC 43595 / DSM 2588 / LMG 13176 / NBRC 15968 / NCIMB 11800 / UQM 2034) TaxID=485918 RepID=A0A979G6K0_CHIPD|nr:LytTR family DNA-binding domain-containing protein [Chitinophaga pinensis]ACU61660.1 response regulator receiver protein [Chitinophaga pinensis DSM 2588]